MSPDVFDLEVYGQDDAPTSQKITSYTFEVSIGVCSYVFITKCKIYLFSSF